MIINVLIDIFDFCCRNHLNWMMRRLILPFQFILLLLNKSSKCQGRLYQWFLSCASHFEHETLLHVIVTYQLSDVTPCEMWLSADCSLWCSFEWFVFSHPKVLRVTSQGVTSRWAQSLGNNVIKLWRYYHLKRRHFSKVTCTWLKPLWYVKRMKVRTDKGLFGMLLNSKKVPISSSIFK